MKRILLILVLSLVWSSVTQVHADFLDLSADSEYYQSISAMVDKGLVDGYQEDNTFRPDQLVTRAEFLKLAYLTNLYSAEGIKPESIEPLLDRTLDLNCFNDVDQNDWYAPIVCLNKQNGNIQGYGDNTFGPNDHINVGEAARMMTPGYPTGSEGHWAEASLTDLAPHALPNSINAIDQLLTRKEAVEMIWRHYIANHAQLKEKESSLLVWLDDDFLDMDYIGKTQYWIGCNYYAKYDGQIYHLNCHPDTTLDPTVMLDVDIDSFKIETSYLDNNQGQRAFSMALDDKALYLRDEQLEDTTGGIFMLLDAKASTELSSVFFGHDSTKIYPIICYEGCHLNNIPFPDADIESFEILDNLYYRDKNSLFYFYPSIKADAPLKIIGADLETFEPTEDGYAKDKNHTYYLGQMMEAER